MTERKRRLITGNGVAAEIYAQKVNDLIRARYTLSDELAILRKRDESPDEFAAYNAYAEECKVKAKAEVYGEAET